MCVICLQGKHLTNREKLIAVNELITDDATDEQLKHFDEVIKEALSDEYEDIRELFEGTHELYGIAGYNENNVDGDMD